MYHLSQRVRENPKFWVVARTGLEVTSSNGDTYSGDLSDIQQLIHFGGTSSFPILAMGQEVGVNFSNGTKMAINLTGFITLPSSIQSGKDFCL